VSRVSGWLSGFLGAYSPPGDERLQFARFDPGRVRDPDVADLPALAQRV